jgi:hypothetical protein
MTTQSGWFTCKFVVDCHGGHSELALDRGAGAFKFEACSGWVLLIRLIRQGCKVDHCVVDDPIERSASSLLLTLNTECGAIRGLDFWFFVFHSFHLLSPLVFPS